MQDAGSDGSWKRSCFGAGIEAGKPLWPGDPLGSEVVPGVVRPDHEGSGGSNLSDPSAHPCSSMSETATPPGGTRLTIFVVSDATGQTAQRMAQSALIQFEEADAEIVRRGGVLTAEDVRRVVIEAASRNALVMHTLVSNELRRVMLAEARQAGVDAMDLMGRVLDRLATRLRLTPAQKPGLLEQLAEARKREIEAVEFAWRHDDGAHTEELDRAEIVLVGVSRTLKTPTMLYLAYSGWFVANVPLVPEVPPPEPLLGVETGRVFCLDMAAFRLRELRASRAQLTGIPVEPYASADRARFELIHARELSRRHGWRLVDVTGKSVEEIAHEIITLRSAPPS